MHRSLILKHVVSASAVLLALALIPVPQGASAPGTSTTAEAPRYDSLEALLRAGRGSGHEVGSFEVFSAGPLPVGWLWVPDDTADGSGQEYVALHATFVSPGPLAPSVVLRTEFLPAQNHATFAAFLDWIVATYPHVGAVSELDLRRRDVSPIAY
jgi:hypothetical protein